MRPPGRWPAGGHGRLGEVLWLGHRGKCARPLTYAETFKAWGPTRAAPKRDELDLTATNLSRAEVNVKRARLTCRANLEVRTDGPLTLRLAGCGRTLRFR